MVDCTVNQISNPDLEVESLGGDFGERQTVGKMLKLNKLYCILQNEQEVKQIRFGHSRTQIPLWGPPRQHSACSKEKRKYIHSQFKG